MDIYQKKKRTGPPRSTDPRSVHFCPNLKLLATPSWANKQKIKEIYAERKNLTEQTGIPHEVDHIIPLRGIDVCGLHVENNLQILTRQNNKNKNNIFVSS